MDTSLPIKLQVSTYKIPMKNKDKYFYFLSIYS